MGHTSKTETPSSPPTIYVRKLGHEHYEATFSHSPLEARLAGTTAEQAIDNLLSWFERALARAEKGVVEEKELVAKFTATIEGINAAKSAKAIVNADGSA